MYNLLKIEGFIYYRNISSIKKYVQNKASLDKNSIKFTGHRTGVNCLAFSDDGLILASGGKVNNFHIAFHHALFKFKFVILIGLYYYHLGHRQRMWIISTYWPQRLDNTFTICQE